MMVGRPLVEFLMQARFMHSGKPKQLHMKS